MIARLLRKDSRHLGPWAAAAALASLIFLLPLGMPEASIDVRSLLQILGFLATAMLSVLALERLIHDDPLAGSDGFLATRPISRVQVMTAKLLAAFVLLVLPGAVLRAAIYAGFAPSLPAAGYALIFGQELLFGATLLAVFLPPALWTTNLPRLILVAIAAGIVFSVLATLGEHLRSEVPSRSIDESAIPFLAAAFQAAIILTACSAAIAFAKSRRQGWNVLFLFVIVAGILIVPNWLPFPPEKFPAYRSPEPLELDFVNPPRRRVEIANDRRVEKITADVQILGLPPSRCAMAVRAETSFVTAGGVAERRTTRGQSRNLGADEEGMVRALLGGPIGPGSSRRVIPVTLLESSGPEPLPRLDLAALRGKIFFQILEARPLADFSIRAGERQSAPPFRFYLKSVSASRSAVEIELHVDAVNSPCLALQGSALKTRLVAALVAPDGTPILVGDSSGESSTTLGSFTLRSIRFTLRTADDSPIPPESIKHGRLKFLTALPIGEISLPFPKW